MAKKKKESEVKYRIELNEKQMRILMKYVEITMRLFMGQSWDFCDEIAALNCDFSPENPNHERIFDSFIGRRDHLREIMNCVFRIAFEPKGYLEGKTDEMLIAEDIWESVRVALDMCKFPLHVGGEPFPKIEKIEG